MLPGPDATLPQGHSVIPGIGASLPEGDRGLGALAMALACHSGRAPQSNGNLMGRGSYQTSDRAGPVQVGSAGVQQAGRVSSSWSGLMRTPRLRMGAWRGVAGVLGVAMPTS